MRVSTFSRSSSMPVLGLHRATAALEGERPGHDADGQRAELARDLRDDRRAAGAGAAALAGGDEHHVGALEHLFDLLGVVLGGPAADLGIRAGAEPAGELAADVELDVGVAHQQRLRVGVDRDELDALEPDVDHAVDGVDAAAADADDLDHGEVVLRSRHVPSFRRRPRRRTRELLSSAKGIELCQPLAPVEPRARPPAEASRTPPAASAAGSPVRQTPTSPASFRSGSPAADIGSNQLAARGRTHPCVHVNAHHESDAGLDTLDHHGVAEVSTAPGSSGRQRVPRVVRELGRGDVDHAGVAAAAGRAARRPSLAESTGPPQRTWVPSASTSRTSAAEPADTERSRVRSGVGRSVITVTAAVSASPVAVSSGRPSGAALTGAYARPVRSTSSKPPGTGAAATGTRSVTTTTSTCGHPCRTSTDSTGPIASTRDATSADDTRASGVPRLTPAAARTWSGETVRVPSTRTSCTASSEDQPTIQAATASTATTTTSRSSRRRRRRRTP